MKLDLRLLLFQLQSTAPSNVPDEGNAPRPIERRLDWVFYKTEMKIWAVGCGMGWTVLKKVWADYEQLLREVFSTFCGQKKNFFLKTL